MANHFIMDDVHTSDPDSYRPLLVTRLMPGFGAVIEGVDLSRPLAAEAKVQLRRAFYDFGVIFLRGQAALTPEQHLELVSLFGVADNGSYRTEKLRSNVDVLVTDENKTPVANQWHSDNSSQDTPSFGTFIQIQACPEIGGNTGWSCTRKAYDCLSPNMQAYLQDLVGIHYWDNRGHRDATYLSNWGTERYFEMQRQFPPVEHPVIKTHPVNGSKSIYVNENYTKHIKGLHRQEARHVMTFLADWVRMPEFCLFHHWQENDIAVWDNFSMQHYALADYSDYRVNQRITFAVDTEDPAGAGTPIAQAAAE